MKIETKGLGVRKRLFEKKLMGQGILGVTLLTLVGCKSGTTPDETFDPGSISDLDITEIHYHPADEGAVDGKIYEFVEIHNAGDGRVDLSGLAFTEGITYSFPSNASLNPDEYFVVASNSDGFEARYDRKPDGVYSGQLDNAGETIILAEASNGRVLIAVTYGDGGAWPKAADGDGFSMVPLNKATQETPSLGLGWRSSFALHGSPGKVDPSIAWLTEILPHTDDPDKDALEIFNPGDDEIDIGGWWLTDDRDVPGKFKIPSPTMIASGEYKVFTSDDFNGSSGSANSFALSEFGEDAYLMASEEGCAAAYCHGITFSAVGTGVSIGRYVNSEGRVFWPAQKEASLGQENKGPGISSVVMTEIFYHPKNDTGEYLEITNISEDEVKLFDADHPANTWRVEGIDFQFPEDVTLAPGEAILLLSDSADEEAFRTAYDLGDEVRVWTYTGVLSNASTTLELKKPLSPETSGDRAGFVPYQIVDEVEYRDTAPWSEGADGGGYALGRKSDTYGNDPKSWATVNPNPGVYGAK
jgi:hypothetical protein